jgi:hypothetical protein
MCEKLLTVPTGNKGTLILDATCAPADIHFPTDTSLLSEAREKLEGMIDQPAPRAFSRNEAETTGSKHILLKTEGKSQQTQEP